jgi:glycosyltransferase involved in cell wall biosynthesis
VVNGRTGILVPARDSRALGNALIRLLDDRSLRARLGTQGRALAEERFTDRHMVDAYQDLYLRLHHAAVARGKANARPRAAAAALKT